MKARDPARSRRGRASAWLAVGMGALILAGTVALASVSLTVADDTRRLGNTINGVLAVPFLFLGPYLAFRLPRNAVGWLLSASALLLTVGGSVRRFAALFSISAIPGGSAAEALSLLLFVFAIVVFPNGRLPARIWLAVATALAALVLVLTTAAAFTFILVTGVVAAGRQLVRFTGAAGTERQQLKWFAYASGIAISLLGVNTAIGCNSLTRAAGACDYVIAADVMWGLTFLALPLGMTMAILRYRLYDVDVLVNRTLVYGATTAAIAASFFVGIVVLQAALRPLTGGSELAVAVSTLVCFALFQPFRRRIQGFVDQLFYRARYDAARTLDAFSVRLRDEVELDAVRADLLDSIDRTVHPASASIWLRGRAR